MEVHAPLEFWLGGTTDYNRNIFFTTKTQRSHREKIDGSLCGVFLFIIYMFLFSSSSSGCEFVENYPNLLGETPIGSG